MSDNGIRFLRLLFEGSAYGFSEYFLDEIAQPSWDQRRRVHDWRNHVPYSIVNAWHALNDDARAIAYYYAKDKAMSEEWE